jgi:hypothetical protein
MKSILLIFSLLTALVAPISLSAAECKDDPNECTTQNLCEVSTEMLNGQKVWSRRPELTGHIKFAKQIGIDCQATDPTDPCDLDAAQCIF